MEGQPRVGTMKNDRLRGILWPGQILLSAVLILGCQRPWLDPATHEVPPSEFKPVATPRAVYLVFEAQNFGSPNARGTRALATLVRHELKASGLFGTLEASLGRDTALLHVTLNKISGGAVSEYLCTLSYLAPGGKEPLVKTASHAIHTPIGVLDPPPGATRVADLRDAASTMTALRDLSYDPLF